MWHQNYRIQHKMRALRFSIELCLLFFPTNGKESGQNVIFQFSMCSISTNILTVLANFLGIQNSIFSKNIGRDRGNTTSVYPNQHIAVDVNAASWQAYTDLMFIFRFIWGCVNNFACRAFMHTILDSRIKAHWLVIIGLSPVVAILVLAPFLSPWVGCAIMQNVSLKPSLIYL